MLQDVRYALRQLAANPSFSFVAIVTLAVGIGANTAIFSIVNGVLLGPVPVERLERLVMVWETDRNSDTSREPASWPDYLDFARRARSFARLEAFVALEANLLPPAGEPERLAALGVTHGFLPMLGLEPVEGRRFIPDEDLPNGPRVAIISAALRRRTFGDGATAVGRTIQLDEQPHTIVGVLDATADFGLQQVLRAAAYARGFADRGDLARVDVWVPLQADAETLPRSTHPILVVGRLAADATVAAAQQEMAAIAADLERTYPENDARGVNLEPLAAVVFGPIRPAMYTLVVAVALVLIVACVNVANLLLARGAARRREVAIRSALGASTRALSRQFLIESLVLAGVAALLGLGLAYGGLQLLLAAAPPDIPRLTDVRVDVRVLAVTSTLAVATAVALCLFPTLQARHVNLEASLRGDGRATAGRERGRLRQALVVAEVSFSVVLLVGAGLLMHSFWNVRQIDPGFQAAGVLKAEYQLPPSRYPADFSRYPDFREMHRFGEALLERAERLPGTVAVALAGNHPLDPGFTNSFVVVGREAEARTWPEISIRRVSPGYFRSVGLALVHGRLFGAPDGTHDAPVLLVNEAAAARFFPGRDPVGQQIAFWGAARTIVGVVANVRFGGLASAAPIAAYVPLAQAPSANGAGVLLVRTEREPMALTGEVRRVFAELDPALAIFGIEPLESTVSRSVAERRFTMLLLAVFAVVALTLGAIGVQGMLSYSVAQRTRELAIRLALGAGPARVRRAVLGEGLALTAVGLVIGLLGALGLSRLLASQLFGVSTADPLTLGTVILLIGVVAAAASYLPAARAARANPVEALRPE
jgi:putative ABC transport system permease protein